MALLEPESLDRQSGWDDLETLKARVLHARPIDPLLRAWSNGSVENKTFQQMTEEFARIVIPRVWERETSLIEQVVAPMLQQRSAGSRDRAGQIAREIAALSLQLHAALGGAAVA